MLKYLNWPKGFYNKSYLPWWLISWRLLTLPILIVASLFMYVALIINQGLYEAESFRKDLM